MLGNIGNEPEEYIYVNSEDDVVVQGFEQPGGNASVFQLTPKDGVDNEWSISSQSNNKYLIPVIHDEVVDLEANSGDPVYFRLHHLEGEGEDAIYKLSVTDEAGNAGFVTMANTKENSDILVQAEDEEPKQKWKFLRPDNGFS